MPQHQITKAIAYLKHDKNLRMIIERSTKPKFSKSQNPFEFLVRSIIYQQLSGKSAGAILKRVRALFKDNKPTPEKVKKLESKKFKSCGLSGQKITYLKDLAKKFLDRTVNPNNFHQMTDEAIREHLIAVRGIGHWTADMFLMFALCRPDILPVGDLGIQKGFQKVFNLKKLPNAKIMEKLAKDWQPYRTIASWYLWKALDTNESDW